MSHNAVNGVWKFSIHWPLRRYNFSYDTALVCFLYKLFWAALWLPKLNKVMEIMYLIGKIVWSLIIFTRVHPIFYTRKMICSLWWTCILIMKLILMWWLLQIYIVIRWVEFWYIPGKNAMYTETNDLSGLDRKFRVICLYNSNI